MREALVIEAFADWLEREGWRVSRGVDFCDVAATRGDERLFAEAKGLTSDSGLDVDTAYGQLLRRMPLEAVEADEAKFALVVPEECLQAALRVPARVRELLGIEVFAVDKDGAVRRTDQPPRQSPPAEVEFGVPVAGIDG